jgi:hypothetical protein
VSGRAGAVLSVIELALVLLAVVGPLMALRGKRRRMWLAVGGGALVLLLMGEAVPRFARRSDLAPALLLYTGWDTQQPPRQVVGQCALAMYAAGHELLTEWSDPFAVMSTRGIRLTRFEYERGSTCQCPFQATVQSYTFFGWPASAVNVSGCERTHTARSRAGEPSCTTGQDIRPGP